MIGTAGLYWQIMLTRKAVEDTGKATHAMERQNDLMEISQRPWVSITFDPVFVGCLGGVFAIEAVVRYKNLGSSTATNANLYCGPIIVDDDWRKELDGFIDVARKKAAECGGCILPNETMERRVDFMELTENVPTLSKSDGKPCFIILVASARYMAGNGFPGGWLETTRAVLLEYREKVQGREDAGFMRRSFPEGEFSCYADVLETVPVKADRTI